MASHRLSAGERRQAIIEASSKLFAERGFRGVTTREIAQAVGVSEPVLYQHFQTKQDLYQAIIESISEQVRCRFEPALAAASEYDRDDRTILTQIATNISLWHDEDPTLSRLLVFSALEGQEFSDLFFAKHAAPQFDLLKQYFEHRIERGTFRSVNPAAAAWAFIGMIAHHSMVRHYHHFDPYPQPKEELIAQMVDLFLHGLQQQIKAGA